LTITLGSDALFYANGIVVMANNRLRLQELLNTCEDFSNEYRFRFNVKKCEIVTNVTVVIEPDNKFLLYNEPLPISKKFLYLGLYFDKNGFSPTDQEGLINEKTRNICGLLMDLGIPNLNPLAIRRIFNKAYVQPIIDYGLIL
jgi:hypothetical protein